jgi:lipopolysaccharide transport system permease protein
MNNLSFSYLVSITLNLTRRDIAARFRGSLLGAFWLVINPLFMLALYYYVFSFILKVRWLILKQNGQSVEQPGALALFCGLIAYLFFAECITRAPALICENSNYVKKVVFPLSVLPVVAVLSSFFSACVNSCLLLLFYLFSVGLPSWHIIFFPLFLLALATATLGVVYGLSALGVYLPDLKAVMGPVSLAFMFLTPIMYPLSLVPQKMRTVVLLNPLSTIVEGLRNALFEQTPPSPHEAGVLAAVAFGLLFLGFHAFKKLRKGFADVI